jgi:hypothetical protein
MSNKHEYESPDAFCAQTSKPGHIQMFITLNSMYKFMISYGTNGPASNPFKGLDFLSLMTSIFTKSHVRGSFLAGRKSRKRSSTSPKKWMASQIFMMYFHAKRKLFNFTKPINIVWIITDLVYIEWHAYTACLGIPSNLHSTVQNKLKSATVRTTSFL